MTLLSPRCHPPHSYSNGSVHKISAVGLKANALPLSSVRSCSHAVKIDAEMLALLPPLFLSRFHSPTYAVMLTLIRSRCHA